MAGSAERHFFAARLRVRTVDLSMDRLGHRCSGFGASVTNGRSVMNFEHLDRSDTYQSVLRR